MTTLSFTHFFDEYGNEYIMEETTFSELESGDKVSASLLDSGTWLCEFLSISVEEIDSFLDEYAFTEEEKKDRVYTHTIFNRLLNGNPVSLIRFQKFLAREGIQIPQYSYKLDHEGNLAEVYTSHDISGYCAVTMQQILKRKGTIKRCANCGKWFVPRVKSTEKYCRRPSPQYENKDCRDAARYIKVMKQRHEDEATRLKKNIRQMFDNSFKDNAQFNSDCKKWANQVKSGEVTYEQYIDWLHSFYKRKYKK